MSFDPSLSLPKHLEPTPYTSQSNPPTQHSYPATATTTQTTSYTSPYQSSNPAASPGARIPSPPAHTTAGYSAHAGRSLSPSRLSSPINRDSTTSTPNTNNSSAVTFQVINENKHYNPQILDYFRKINIDRCGLNYHIVSVFGSQSTGKSTLLNALFGTRFDVMNEVQRQQTTKGIWMAMSQKSPTNIFSLSDQPSSAQGEQPNLLVMDVEGTDGRERGEDQDFERKSALFALATSEILIVNMWENQVGLYQGANMGLLKTVFEVNLTLFHTSSKTNRSLILFVIRDHIGTTPLDNLKRTVIADLERIWESLSKPEAAAHARLDDFFDLQFYTLPHKILMAEKFESETHNLSQYFVQTQSPSYLFKKEYHRGIPLDGWPMYSEQIWEQIEQNKDLDLPTQQTLVARFRCEEIANQAWQQFETSLLDAQKDTNNALGGNEVVEKFGAIISGIRGNALELYDSLASRYAKPVYLGKREELQNRIDTRLSNLYRAQLLALHQTAVGNFKTLIKTSQKQGSRVPFIEILEHGYEKATNYFVNGAQESSVDPKVFTFESELSALERELKAVEEAAKAGEIKRISVQANKKIVREFNNELESYFVDPKDDTWDKVLVFFNNTVLFALTSVTTKYKKVTNGPSSNNITSSGHDFGVGGTDEENERGVREIRRSAWIALDTALKQITRDENVLFRLREHFEDLFKYDQNGVPIVWKAGDDIESPYIAAREKALQMLPIFATAKLKNGQVLTPDVDDSDKASHGDDDDEEEEFTNSLDTENFPYRITNSKEQDLSKRFRKQADATYIEAKRSTTQLAKSVPFYMIVLLVLLGWNEFMAVLRNPFLFLFVLLAGAGAYVAHTLNLWGPIFSVSNAMVDRTLEVGKQRLRELLEDGSKNNANATAPRRRLVEEEPVTENIQLQELKRPSNDTLNDEDY